MAADPFDTLGVDPTFDLDPGAVQRAYLRRAAACHPDLAGTDPDRSAEAAQRSAALNAARATLLHPEARARALLERLEGRGGGGAASGSGGGPADPAGAEADLPEGFLIEIMETRMAVEEAAESGDSDDLARWQDWVAAERARYIERLGGLFAAFAETVDDDAGRVGRLAEIQRQLNAWRYIERMLEQIGG